MMLVCFHTPQGHLHLHSQGHLHLHSTRTLTPTQHKNICTYTVQGHLHLQGTHALNPETFFDSGISDLKELDNISTDHKIAECCREKVIVSQPVKKSEHWQVLLLNAAVFTQ